MTAQTEDFIISRIFNASCQRVWDAWTQPEQIARWFGPKGVVTTVLMQDLQPGGFLHARMDMPNAGSLWAKLAYREITPPSRLVWLHSFSDAQANVVRAPFFDGTWPLELLSTLTLEAQGYDTLLTLHWTPFNAAEAERQAFAANKPSMEQGWTGSFDELDRIFAGV